MSHPIKIPSSLFLVALLLVIISCKKNPTGPLVDDTQPGRRDYVWTVDTLKLGWDVFYAARMWGSSANDVWLVGGSNASWNTIWHYDGVQWKKDSLSRIGDPTALWGFGEHDVWLGNNDGSFWQNDGNSWTKFSEPRILGYEKLAICNIWGENSNNVWAVGFADSAIGTNVSRGTILHFDGIRWSFIQVPNLRVSFLDIRKQKTSGIFFLEAWSTNNAVGDAYKLYVFDGTNMREVYSGDYYGNLEEVNGEIFFVRQSKIYRYRESELYVWKDFSQTTYGGWLFGRSEKDFFGEQKGGGIMHYNGTDLQLVYPMTMEIWCGFIFEKDVFFECQNASQGLYIVIHGKLKE